MYVRFMFVTRDSATDEISSDLYEGHCDRTNYAWLRSHVRGGCPIGSYVTVQTVTYADNGQAINYGEPQVIGRALGKLRYNAIERMMEDMGWTRERAALEYDTDGTQRFAVPGHTFG